MTVICDCFDLQLTWFRDAKFVQQLVRRLYEGITHRLPLVAFRPERQAMLVCEDDFLCLDRSARRSRDFET
jgi:hypothetical protein